jgi:aubergine-like protein
MTVGYDVCHDATDKKKSYGALIATMDMKRSQKYFSTVEPHKSGEEISSQFSVNIAKALHTYKDEHQELPERIVVYRDGVGDGQIDYVKDIEVKAIDQTLQEIYAKQNAGKPKWAYILVNKRINTRFFKRETNPPPGTVVDDVVTLPDRFDFYMITQAVHQGTVAPTAYTILHDTLDLEADKIQILTYKWSHW